MSRPGRAPGELLLGEWACLGALAEGPSHGFAIASRLRPEGDLGRIWSLSRPLTYRAIDHLVRLGHAEPVGEEPGIAGGKRTVVTITPSGRSALEQWIVRPVEHLREVRDELLLKLHLARELGVDATSMIDDQHRIVVRLRDALFEQANSEGSGVVALWRLEAADATLRFLDALVTPPRRRGSASE